MTLARQWKDLRRAVRERWLQDFIFIHINKTGGSSIEKALGLSFEHRTALEKRAALGPRLWDRKFSFAFVRNPWDKVVSQYHYRVQREKTGLQLANVSFPDWVRLVFADRDPAFHNPPRMMLPQIDWVSDENGLVLVRFIGRFENLEEDFQEVCRRIGRTATLPHAKPSTRGDYRSYYDDASAEIVARWFARDLEAFGYRF